MESSYLSSGHFMESYDDDDDDGADHMYGFNDSRESQSTRNVWECTFCDKAFASRKRLRAHKKDHYKNKTFSCKVCPAHFMSYVGWLFHFRKHRSDLQYSCDICGAKYCSFQQLVRHTEAHEYRKESKFICNFCSKAFSLQYELLTHEREAHSITDNYGNESRILDVYSCAICYQAFRKLSQYRNHLEKSVSCRPYSCERCGKGFLSLIQYQSHTSNYTKCRELSEKLIRKKFCAMIPQIKIPRLETIVRCNRPAIDQDTVESILQSNHSTDENGVESILRSNRPVIIRRVEKHKSFFCNECDRVFHKIHHRREHWIRNKNCRPYCCNDCDAKFLSKDRLQIHVRIHSYKCQTCLRRFMLKNEFDHHFCKNPSRMYEPEHETPDVRVARKIASWPHSGIIKQKNYKFVCQSCCKTYSTENELQSHIDHVSQRLFLCPKCSKTSIFSNKCTFGFHMINTHGVDK